MRLDTFPTDQEHPRLTPRVFGRVQDVGLSRVAAGCAFEARGVGSEGLGELVHLLSEGGARAIREGGGAKVGGEVLDDRSDGAGENYRWIRCWFEVIWPCGWAREHAVEGFQEGAVFAVGCR